MPTEPTKADPLKRKRRWFQFSLRPLMIGVTLLAVPCAYVGWQAKIVRERNYMLHRVETVDNGMVTGESAPFLRGILGDQSIALVELPLETSAHERHAVHEAFPEALIIGYRMEPVNGKVQGSVFLMFPDDPDGQGRPPER